MKLKNLLLASGLLSMFMMSESSYAIMAICNEVPLYNSIQNSTFGAEAAAGAAWGCNTFSTNGGGGSTSANLSYDFSTDVWNGTDSVPTFNGNGTASSTLSTGVLNTSLAGSPIVSQGYQSSTVMSSALWDTLTFNNLPASGEMVTETLTLDGSIGANGSGAYNLFAGYGNQNGNLSQGNLPGSVTYTFLAQNDVPVEVGVELSADSSGGAGSGVNLADSVFSISVPDGVTFTSASGVFANVNNGTVPEPTSGALIALGLALIGFFTLRRSA